MPAADASSMVHMTVSLIPPEGAPAWFTAFANSFNDRFNRVESLLEEKLGAITQKLKDDDEKLDGLEFEIESLQANLKPIETENIDLLMIWKTDHVGKIWSSSA